MIPPFFRRRRNRELDEEIRAHLAMAVWDRIERGEDPAAAERAVIREFGDPVLIKEVTRSMWGWAAVEQLWRDLRYAMRGLRHNPAFTTVAILLLALGIGANTAIFSLIDALMLRLLSVHNPGSLWQVKTNDQGDTFSRPIVRLFEDQQAVFSSVAGFTGWNFNVGPPGAVYRVSGAVVTGEFYTTLGLKAVIGRLLTPEDDRPGAPLVAVVSHDYWLTHLGGRFDRVGSAILIGGAPVTIVGISPPGFKGANVGANAEITICVAALPRVTPEAAALLGPGNFWLRVLVRTPDGVSPAAAANRLNTVWPRISQAAIPPGWPADRRTDLAQTRFQLVPGGTGWTWMRRIFREPLLVLMVLVAMVLLIACANVASLLLGRGAARRKEIAVRLAIGAGRGRLIRQLLAESALLSVIGSGLGILIAWPASRLLLNSISNPQMQISLDVTPDARVLAFTSALAVLTALLFGLAPAFQITAVGPAPALKEGERGSARARLLSGLVTTQVAISMMLLIGAGLFVRTVGNLRRVDAGFSSQGVLVIDLDERRTPLPLEIVPEIERLPGVVSASVSTHTPLNGSTWSEPAVPRGVPLPEKDNAFFIGAGPEYFTALRIPIVLGRDFSAYDTNGRPAVAIVNEAYAARWFPHGNALGARLSANVRHEPEDLEIVGVAGNTSLSGLRQPAPPTVYVSYFQLHGDFPTSVEVRANRSLGSVAAEVQRELQSRLPAQPIEVHLLASQVDNTMLQERMMAMLGAAFGALALILTCAGLYGLLSYSGARRHREIGIRMALGARPGDVIRGEIAGAIRPVLFGIAFALPCAWLLSGLVHSMFFGVSAADPITTAGAVTLVIACGAIASWLPARRASRVDPLNALRHE